MKKSPRYLTTRARTFGTVTAFAVFAFTLLGLSLAESSTGSEQGYESTALVALPAGEFRSHPRTGWIDLDQLEQMLTDSSTTQATASTLDMSLSEFSRSIWAVREGERLRLKAVGTSPEDSQRRLLVLLNRVDAELAELVNEEGRALREFLEGLAQENRQQLLMLKKATPSTIAESRFEPREGERRQRADLMGEISLIEAQLQQIELFLSGQAKDVSLSGNILENSTLQRLRGELERKQSELSRLRATYTDESRAISDKRREVEVAQAALESGQKIYLQSKRDDLRLQVKALKEHLAAFELAIRPEVGVVASSGAEQVESDLNSLEKRIREHQVTEQRVKEWARLEVIETPKPGSPQVRWSLPSSETVLKSLSFGLLMGLGAAFLSALSHRRRRRRAEAFLQLPVLGAIEPLSGKEAQAWSRAVAEAGKELAPWQSAPLLCLDELGLAGAERLLSFQRIAQAVRRQSPADFRLGIFGAGIGRDLVALGLARHLSTPTRGALLLDADGTEGSLSKLLGGVRVLGFSDFLGGYPHGEELVMSRPDEDFHFTPWGCQVDEAVADRIERLDGFLQSVEKRVLLASLSNSTSNWPWFERLDAAILVADPAQPREKQMKTLQDSLLSSKLPIIGVVLYDEESYSVVDGGTLGR